MAKPRDAYHRKPTGPTRSKSATWQDFNERVLWRRVTLGGQRHNVAIPVWNMGDRGRDEAFRGHYQGHFGKQGIQDAGPVVQVNHKAWLTLPPLIARRYQFQMALMATVAATVRERVAVREKGMDNQRLGPFYNQPAGMWSGFEVRGGKTGNPKAAFYRSSLTTWFAMLNGKTDGVGRFGKLTLKEQNALLRKMKRYGQHKNIRVQNRLKARTAQQSAKSVGAARGRDILGLTPAELYAVFNFLFRHAAQTFLAGKVEYTPGELTPRGDPHLLRRLPRRAALT